MLYQYIVATEHHFDCTQSEAAAIKQLRVLVVETASYFREIERTSIAPVCTAGRK